MSRLLTRTIGQIRRPGRVSLSATIVGAALAVGAAPFGVPTAAADSSCLRTSASCANADLRGVIIDNRVDVDPEKDFTGADLSGAYIRTSMIRPNFTDATLRDASLEYISLWGANFTRADASGTYFTDSNLTNANLTDARFGRARLVRTNLTGATLTGVHLGGAFVFYADFSRVKGMTREDFDAAGTIGEPAVYPPSGPGVPPGAGWSMFGSS